MARPNTTTKCIKLDEKKNELKRFVISVISHYILVYQTSWLLLSRLYYYYIGLGSMGLILVTLCFLGFFYFYFFIIITVISSFRLIMKGGIIKKRNVYLTSFALNPYFTSKQAIWISSASQTLQDEQERSCCKFVANERCRGNTC